MLTWIRSVWAWVVIGRLRATKVSSQACYRSHKALDGHRPLCLHPLTSLDRPTMLITKTYHDVPTKLSPNGRPIRIFVIAPTIAGYPNAKFPGEPSARSILGRGLRIVEMLLYMQYRCGLF